MGILNRIDDFYPSVFVAFFSFVCRNSGGASKCELMCFFSMTPRLVLGAHITFFKRHEPFGGLRSPTSYLSHTRILAHDRQHCRCHAPARLPHTGGSSDGKSGVGHPYEPREPFDLAHHPCPNLYGCSFAQEPRRRSGSSHPPVSLSRASQFAGSQRQLGLAGLGWKDGAPPRLKWQSQRWHPGVGGQEYRPLQSNVAGAAEQSEPGFQICHRVSPDQAKGIQWVKWYPKEIKLSIENPKNPQKFKNSYQTHTYLSEAMIKTSRLTIRFLPLPHPTSRPTAPGARPVRNRSTIGHGWKSD